jgi:heme/copper-type cytochrome/quinol oxidase subunit 2
MRAPVVVEKSQADFDHWAASQPPIKSDEQQGEKLPSGPTLPKQVAQ